MNGSWPSSRSGSCASCGGPAAWRSSFSSAQRIRCTTASLAMRHWPRRNAFAARAMPRYPSSWRRRSRGGPPTPGATCGVDSHPACEKRCSRGTPAGRSLGCVSLLLEPESAPAPCRRPDGRRGALSHDANVINTRIGRAPSFAAAYEYGRQSRLVHHVAKSLRRGAEIILQQHNDAVGFEEPTDGCEETSMQVPVLVVDTQLARRLVGKMRGIADHEIPLFRRRNMVQII